MKAQQQERRRRESGSASGSGGGDGQEPGHPAHPPAEEFARFREAWMRDRGRPSARQDPADPEEDRARLHFDRMWAQSHPPR